MFAILKKEFKTYFLTPIGYIFVAIFLLIAGYIFYKYTFSAGVTLFQYVIWDSSIILTFLSPVLTMRMFAEEKKTGTDQLLLTSPKSIVSIVLGKFLAATLVIIISLVFLVVFYGILRYFGPVNLTEPLVGILGFLLLAMSYIAFGMFISSLTSNLVLAAIVPIAFNFVLMFVANFSGVLEMLSLMGMFQKFPQGIISLKEVVGYCSFIVLFNLLTILVLQRRKSVK